MIIIPCGHRQSLWIIVDNVTTTATSGDHGGNRGHAKRTVFTRTQLTEMEQRFREQSFLSREERRELADQLRLTERQIMIWFQNRRFVYRPQMTPRHAIFSKFGSLQCLPLGWPTLVIFVLLVTSRRHVPPI